MAIKRIETLKGSKKIDAAIQMLKMALGVEQVVVITATREEDLIKSSIHAYTDSDEQTEIMMEYGLMAFRQQNN